MWIAALAAVPVGLLILLGVALALGLSLSGSIGAAAEEAVKQTDELNTGDQEPDDATRAGAGSKPVDEYAVSTGAEGCAGLPDMPPPGEATDSPAEILTQWSTVSNLAFGRADPRYLDCLYAIDGVLYQNRVDYIEANGPTPRALEYREPYAAVEVAEATVVMCYQPYFQGQPEGEVEQAKFELRGGYWAQVAQYDCSA